MKLIRSINPITCVLFSLCIISTSCKKSSSSTPAPTAADAADIASASMQVGSGGFADQASDVTTLSVATGYGFSASNGNTENGLPPGAQGRLACGVPFDTSVTRTYTGPNVTASFTHQWELLLDCVDTSLTFTGNFTGSYDGPNITGTRSGTRNWVVTGIGSAYTAYVLNGTFSSNGVWTMKVRNMNTFTNTIAITGTNITVDKTPSNLGRITGGSGTINISCVVSNGNTYTFTGTIVFNGNHTATVTINGNTYIILI